MPADFLDRYAQGTSVCHRLPARLKVLLALGVILLAGLLPVRLWPLHGCLACLVFAGHSLAGIPAAYLARRMLLIGPLAALLALAAPLSKGFAGGWETAAGIIVRALVAFLAALWLVNTTPFDRLLAALRGLGMPRVFAALLEFTYRYLFVVFDELARMRTAQRARTFGRRRAWPEFGAATRTVGTLLIRSLNRSERIHNAMLARGWDGEPRLLDG